MTAGDVPESDGRSLGEDRRVAPIGVVIVTGSCCIPGMAPFEERARQIVEQAVAETRVAAWVKVVPATAAYMGGVPKRVMAELIARFNATGDVGLPAVLVNGESVSSGAPTLDDVKSALLRTSSGRAEGAQA